MVDQDSQQQAPAGSAPEAGAVDSILPITIYGPEISYFTGKLEAVVRFMELPYKRVAKGPTSREVRASGALQVPCVQLADGRLMTDSTPIINWLDQRFPEYSVIPANPVLAFLSRLLEDYADEWLWRPAMHYRWDYAEGAAHQSRVLVEEAAGDVPLPEFVIRHLIKSRQRTLFTRGDGVTAETWDHVEKTYLDTLKQFDTFLQDRPFLLGSRPSLSDFGFFGPMFRHFSMDPTSARIMRETAPAVFEWNARLWNARASTLGGELLDHMPADLGPMFDAVGSAYLPYLCANAEAWKSRSSHFDVEIEGVPYRHIRTSRYRVWCLEELRRHFENLTESQQGEARAWLAEHGCWEPLWRVADPASGLDPNREAPFAGTGSMTGLIDGAADKRYWWWKATPKAR